MLKPSPSLLLAALCGIFAVGFTGASAQQPASLPDIRKLMTEVEEHQKQLDKVREDFTYTSQITTEDVDGSGRVTKTETMELEHFFVNSHQIFRTVKKNGKPLDGHELDKETERVTQRVERAQTTPAGQVLDAHTIGVRKLLQLMEVRNPRRMAFRGRPTIVFDFAGSKDAKTHGLEEDISKKLEGTIWIDEADRQVSHLEVRFNDNFRIGGGLVATIQKGSNFSVDQAPVGSGLWMPTGGEGSIQARVLLFKGIRERFHERDYDYKRFHAEAEQGKEAHVVGK
jgi:hypothetical protein